MINNTADLDQEISLLEEEELSKRNELLRHVITPSATLHTITGLFMSWVNAGRVHKESETHFDLSSFATKMVFPLTLLRTMLKQSVLPLWHLFKFLLGKENN